MRIKRKDEFGDIGTVVYYNFHYFIPDPDYVLDPELIPTQRRNNVVAYNNYLKLETKNLYYYLNLNIIYLLTFVHFSF